MLAEAGIGTGIHYPTPCHLMEPYREFADRSLPIAEAAAQRQLSLPMSPFLRVEDVERVAELVNQVAVRGVPR